MARCPPHHNIGHSSDNDGTDSSVSFRLDSDNAVGVDFPIDITDVTTQTYLYGEWVETRVEPVGTALGSGLRGGSLTGVRKDVFLQAA
ncbi:hypothetical protein ABHI18_000420 [Aspergillus niger]